MIETTPWEKRLTELRNEFEQGQQMLNDLDAETTRVRESLLRISGAIQMLEEVIDAQSAQTTSPSEDAANGPDAP